MKKIYPAGSFRNKAANKSERFSLNGSSLLLKDNNLRLKEPVSCYGATPDMVSGVLSKEELEEYRVICFLKYT